MPAIFYGFADIDIVRSHKYSEGILDITGILVKFIPEMGHFWPKLTQNIPQN
jgi:hypothetical protein